MAALGLAMVLGGCSSGALIDKLPGEMAEPADAPTRPVTPYVYPAVHDIPPPRATPTMSEDQQIKLEKDLAVARDKQETHEKAAVAPAKKKPPAAQPGADADAQDGAKTKP
ncbi:MAG TPA: hypothetical protein VFW22_12920 [Pseudolabrys sp.]|nr:hypothetical protein [Pseudolabrys sp.]